MEHNPSEEQVAPIPPMPQERLNSLLSRRTLTISISVETLVRYSLLAIGWVCVLGGYVLIGYADHVSSGSQE